MYFYKMKPDGQWHYSTSHGSVYDDYARCIRQTYDSGYIIVGSTSSYGGCLSNVYVVKTDITGMSTPYNGIFKTPDKENNLISVYPNPFHDNFTVQVHEAKPTHGVLIISNMLGQEILRYAIKPGEKIFSVKPENLPPGLYQYHWFSEGVVKASGKMVAY
ncbi:MAG: hypothetical protein BWY70_00925 [Bacteroidetes bacterium ADurb.Bin408]|nr:MAG: hypothetical protein BWY70_00925 [Bacteroidetes bacterium ADurb.Bin408]